MVMKVVFSILALTSDVVFSFLLIGFYILFLLLGKLSLGIDLELALRVDGPFVLSVSFLLVNEELLEAHALLILFREEDWLGVAAKSSSLGALLSGLPKGAC